MARLEGSWRKEAEACDLDYDATWGPSMSHASTVILDPKPRLWIYGLAHVDAQGRIRAPFDRIVHVNHKLPRTPHAEVRYVWTTLGPAQAARKDPGTAIGLIADYMIAAMEMAKIDHKCQTVRIYLPDGTDHQAAKLFVKAIGVLRSKVAPSPTGSAAKLQGRVVGQWLLLDF
jgi:hypothetical protein